jgi:hypothetical protein
MKVPITLELGATGITGKVLVDIVPPRVTVLLHVVGGDLIRDALVAERGNQPIKDRRGVALSHCRPDAVSIKVGANLVDQARGPGEAANAVDHPDRMVDGGCAVANFGLIVVPALLSPNCRRGDHGRSDQRDQFALRIGVAVDVSLRCLDRPVTGQQLHIAQRAAGLVHQPGRAGDKRSAARVRSHMAKTCCKWRGRRLDQW